MRACVRLQGLNRVLQIRDIASMAASLAAERAARGGGEPDSFEAVLPAQLAIKKQVCSSACACTQVPVGGLCNAVNYSTDALCVQDLSDVFHGPSRRPLHTYLPLARSVPAIGGGAVLARAPGQNDGSGSWSAARPAARPFLKCGARKRAVVPVARSQPVRRRANESALCWSEHCYP